MSRGTGEQVTRTATRKKAVVAATIGNFIEWYDFVIYAFFASVIASLYFPSESELASLMVTFAAFGVSFLVRPLGALVIGHYGDKVGRRSTLATVILLMSGATFFIGILPTYDQVGVLAPLLMVLARLVQGFSAGGEFGGATSYMVEYAPAKRRGLYGSWQGFTQALPILVGVLLGAVLTSALPHDILHSWGWRVPFLIALPMGAIGLYLRLRLDETPNFKALRESQDVKRVPLKETVVSHRRPMLTGVGLVLVFTTLTYLLLFLPTYLPQAFGISSSTAFWASVIAAAVYLLGCPVAGMLSDRVGRKPFLIAASLIATALMIPGFWLLSLGTLTAILSAHLILGIALAFLGGTVPTTLSELFPTNVRYSGLSLSYSLTVSIFGGFSPLISTFLLSTTGNSLAPAFYVAAAGFISLLTAIFMRETARSSLR